MAQTMHELRPVAALTGIEMERLVRDRGPRTVAGPGQPGLLWRVVLVAMGFGIAVTGWMLILTVFLSFIGLPLFMFGLALMQSQER
ncbi:MAG TPA: hypothetical protein VEN95_04675 [Actinomycetota bacterium]|jgi:hypothetical protein|nr:hypothetical protein [Actinomycetota bacterium]